MTRNLPQPADGACSRTEIHDHVMMYIASGNRQRTSYSSRLTYPPSPREVHHLSGAHYNRLNAQFGTPAVWVFLRLASRRNSVTAIVSTATGGKSARDGISWHYRGSWPQVFALGPVFAGIKVRLVGSLSPGATLGGPNYSAG